MHEYTRCLAVQMREFNVPVNTVAPGGTVTHRFMANKGFAYDAIAADTTQKRESSLCRLGMVDDVANAVAMLMSPEAAFISGQVLRVDGGEQTFPC